MSRLPASSKRPGTTPSRTEAGTGSSYELSPALNKIQLVFSCLSQTASPRDTVPPRRSINPSEGKWLPRKQQEVDGAPRLFLQGQGVLDTGKDGALHSLSGQPSQAPAQGGEAAYLTAMREDDHHAAVQSTVVPPCQLHQSLDHLLQERAEGEPDR